MEKPVRYCCWACIPLKNPSRRVFWPLECIIAILSIVFFHWRLLCFVVVSEKILVRLHNVENQNWICYPLNPVLRISPHSFMLVNDFVSTLPTTDDLNPGQKSQAPWTLRTCPEKWVLVSFSGGWILLGK